MQNKTNGKLIVFEGPDGVGKTTLAKAVTIKLIEREIPAEYVSFPGNELGTLGHLVYTLHHDSALFGVNTINPISLQVLHIAAHIDAIKNRISPAIQMGQWIILDRYWWSTWVYGRASGVDDNILDVMIDLERLCWDPIRPELIILVEREDSLVIDTGTKWEALKQLYNQIQHREQDSVNVINIKNESLERTINKILEELVML